MKWVCLLSTILVLKTEQIEGDTHSAWILQTDIMPEDDRFKPPIGNGQTATNVLSDTIYLDGVYSGYERNSHRARIQATNAIDIVDRNADRHYKLDMYRAVFTQTISGASYHATIDYYAHRAHPCLLVTELEIRRKSETLGDITVSLSVNLGKESDDIVFDTKTSGYWLGRIRETEMNDSESVVVKHHWSPVPDNITLGNNESSEKKFFLTSVGARWTNPERDFQDGQAEAERGTLMKTHVDLAESIWERGRIDLDRDDAADWPVLNAAMYHIMCSVPLEDDGHFYGLSPGGLSRGGKIHPNKTGGPFNDYAGHVFWDMDTWIMPPMMMFYHWVAPIMIGSRTRVLDEVMRHARNTGYRGARYPWEQAFSGSETCPWDPASEYQVHVSADVSYSIRQFIDATGDLAALERTNMYKTANMIARFWASRVTRNMRDDRYEIHGVMGPDEYHFNINNSIFTNYNAKLSLKLPTYLAKMRGLDLEDDELRHFEAVAKKMYIPYDEQNDFHIQFEGFNFNEKIKQSDVVLLGYPLMLPMSAQTRKNDLEIYERVTDEHGPDTGTWSMHTVGWLELGNQTKAAEMFRMMFRNINGPFKVFSEKPAEAEEGVRCVNFITGAGGLLQAVVFGYGGIRVRAHKMELDPYPLPGIGAWTLRHIDYRGSSIDIRIDNTYVQVTLVKQDSSDGADELYMHIPSTRQTEMLYMHVPVKVSRQKVSLYVKSKEFYNRNSAVSMNISLALMIFSVLMI